MTTPKSKRFSLPVGTLAHYKPTYAATPPAPEHNLSPQQEEEEEEEEEEEQDQDQEEDASTETHYSILRLPPTATPAQIKQSYRLLRTEYFSTDPAKYRALQEAYLVLVDEEARGVYDGSLGLGVEGGLRGRGTGLLTPPREGARMRPMSMMGMGTGTGMGMGMMGFGEMRVRGRVNELERPSATDPTCTIPSPTTTIPSPTLTAKTTTTTGGSIESRIGAARPKTKERDPNWYLKHSKAASTVIPPSTPISTSFSSTPASASASTPKSTPTSTSALPTPSVPAITNAKRELGHHRRRSLIPVLLSARNRAGTMG